MASDTVTLELDGVVPVKLYADAMGHLDDLIDTLTDEVSGQAGIVWLVEDLEFSEVASAEPVAYASAKATIRGDAPNSNPVERVVRAYSSVGKALAAHTPIPYSDLVRKRAEKLVAVLNGKIVAIRFETSEDEWTVSNLPTREQRLRTFAAYGAIDGRVETLTRRRGLRFVLYDTVTDRAISCYLGSDQEDMIRDVWGKRAVVEGWISRDPLTGRPTTIRQITRVMTVDEVPPGSYLRARGILAANAGGLAPEEAIRRFRDAQPN
jgi:hypothetical protein